MFLGVPQTYKDAILEPGPRLNLVLGPNGKCMQCGQVLVCLTHCWYNKLFTGDDTGTGKSSFVCALCLGLAGGTTVRYSA